MSHPKYPRVQRGDLWIPASLLNNHSESLERAADFYAPPSGGLDFGVPGAAPPSRVELIAQLVAVDGSTPPKYSWLRYLDLRTDGTTTYNPDLIHGGPFYYPDAFLSAYELNANPNAPIGSLVRLWLSWEGECLIFAWPSLEGVTVSNMTFKNGTVTYDNEAFVWKNNSVFAFPSSSSPSTPPAGRLVIPVLPSKPTYTGLNGEFVTDCNALYKYSTTLTAWNTYPKTINVIGSGTPKVPVFTATSGGYDLNTSITNDTTNNRVGINTDAATTTNALTVTPNVTTDNGIVVDQPSSATGDPLLINKAGDNTTPILQVTATGGTIVTPTATTTTGLQLNQPTSATADPLKITKPGDDTTPILQVGPAGNIIVTPSSASQTAIAITTANNPSQPALSITATGTPTADLFSITNGSAVKVLAVTDDYTLQFPTTSSAATAPAANLSLPTLTVSGAPSWTPAAGEYPIEWNATDKALYVWDGASWDPIVGSSPAGATNDVQINVSGAFSVDTGNFIYDPSAHELTVQGGTATAKLGGATNGAELGGGPLLLDTDTWPGSPADGQLGYDGTHLYFQHGATLTDLLAGGGSVGGSDTQVLYNDTGAETGDANLTWDYTAQLFTVTGTSSKSATLGGASQAIYGTDGTRTAYLCDGTSAGSFVNGSFTADLGTTGKAGEFHDGTHAVYLCDGSYGVDIPTGGINSSSGYYTHATPGIGASFTVGGVTYTFTDGLLTSAV